MAVAVHEARPSARPAWRGRLDLAFREAGERTVMQREAVRMPLAVQRPFYPEGPAVCHALALHPPGGMVGGDRLEMAFRVEQGARALVSTPAAAKWYRGLAPAEQIVAQWLGTGARFEWLPQETIVFDGADVRQRLRVELAPDAAWLGWDVTRFGRSARGETFDTGAWRSYTEVWRGERPLWIDRQRLDGGSPLLRGAYGLAGEPVIGTLAWLGREVPDALVEQAHARWVAGGYRGEAGVTRLVEGLLCRYRGASSADARAWFTEVWALLREFDGRPRAPAPRIWAT